MIIPFSVLALCQILGISHSHHSIENNYIPTVLTKPFVIKSLKGTHEENQLNSHSNVNL